MSVWPTFRCDAPSCTHHVGGSPGETIPFGWLRIEGDGQALDCCSWDCVLRYAAEQPPVVTIHIDDVPPLDGCDETRGSA